MKKSPRVIPTLSIVAVVIDNLEVNRRFISSIRQYTQGRYELILIDNASNDEKAVKFFKQVADRYFRFPKIVSLAHAWNKGISLSRGKYVAVVNNDVVVPPDWFPSLQETLDKNKKAGLVHPLTPWLLKKSIRDGTLSDFGKDFSKPLKLRRFKDIVWGEFMVFKRKALQATGGFNEIYEKLHAEDLEMVFQLFSKGFDLFIDPRIFIYHEGGSSHKLGVRSKKELTGIREKNWKLFLSRWPKYTKGWK